MRELARAERLYAWLSPGRPEDLGFYDADSLAWFGSIAHEEDAFVTLSATDIEALGASVPGLRLRSRAA
jgi:hypothetical protein